MFKNLFKKAQDAISDFTDKVTQEEQKAQSQQAWSGNNASDDKKEQEGDFSGGGFVNPYANMQEDPSNPLLQPIHGVTLRDYAAAAARLADGVTEDEICRALGIERPLWDEANQLWQKRMQQDAEFVVSNVYGRYFGEVDTHPTLGALKKSANGEPAPQNDNLARLNSDEAYYYELCGARQAAYDAGLDGAQWILDNFGITLGNFQSAASKWMLDTSRIVQMFSHQEQKQKEYAEKIAKENGGNVADDIDF